jgi:CBS domain containing-hemolysin-like protein
MASIQVQISVICICLLLSAFFSGMEIAYVSSNKIHIELEKKQDTFLAKILARLTAKPSQFIATMLLGNNIALVVYGYFMGALLQNALEGMPFGENMGWLNTFLTDFGLLSQTIISTLVILLTAEFLPKVFFQIYANKLLRFFAAPAYFFYVIFSFISRFVIWISDFILKRFFKTDGDEVQLVFTKVELGNYISEQMEAVSEHEEVDTEIQIFQNALEFSEVKSREVMIPRTEIVAVDERTTPLSLNKKFCETGLSKVLVYKDTIDDIIGYVHSSELFKKPRTLSSVVMPVIYVPETMLVKDVLNVLTKKRKSIAVVIDEYGGTSGMMTVEDIVEELFGEIEDEHDQVALKEEILGDNHFIFSARYEIDYLNEVHKLDFPKHENYETLGGLIVKHAEHIPQVGDRIVIDPWVFLIKETSSTKIELVEVLRNEE